MSLLSNVVIPFNVREIKAVKQRSTNRAARARGRNRTMQVVAGHGIQDLVTIQPYFKIAPENLEAFKKNVTEGFYPLMAKEEQCVYYNFTFSEDGTKAHCREGYHGAEGALFHLDNVAVPLGIAQELGTLETLEVHGPEKELEKLREPLKGLPVTWYSQL